MIKAINERNREAAERSGEPLVTFALFAYNQERFIRSAIEGAFAQTYEPMEIILSDDCSSDGTYDLMCQMAQEYNGPHKIILNRNEKNLGVCAHVNRVFNLASGQLVVVAAGDDVSLPERVRRMTDVWKKSGASAVYCDANLVDETGSGIGYWAMPKNRAEANVERLTCGGRSVSVRFYGAGAAYDKEIFNRFGPLPLDLLNEDDNLATRAALMNGVAYLNEPLMRYRKHGGNLSFWVKMSNARNGFSRMFVLAQTLENLDANHRHAIGYMEKTCGGGSLLVTRFRAHMVSNRVRCGLLYVLSGRYKKGVFSGSGLSGARLVHKVVAEFLVVSFWVVRALANKALNPLLRFWKREASISH